MTQPAPLDEAPPVRIVTGGWLADQKFPPLTWVVRGLIAEGLTLFVGAPKLGKSWLILAVALAKASGGKALGCIDVGDPRPVLYLALEDGYRRLQDRAFHLQESRDIPDGLHIIIKGSYPQLMAGLRDWLDQYRDDEPLVIVDTLGRLRPPRKSGEDAYSADYKFAADLKRVIDEVTGGALVLVHHTNKREGGDFVEAVSGTQGLAGAADSTLVLARRRHEDGAILSVTGRDVPEAEYAITSDAGRWTLVGGSLDEARAAATTQKETEALSEDSVAIVEFVKGRQAPCSIKDVAEGTGIDTEKVRRYLSRAADRGAIKREARGKYTSVPTVRSVPTSRNQDTQDSWDTPGTAAAGYWKGSGQPVSVVTPIRGGDGA